MTSTPSKVGSRSYREVVDGHESTDTSLLVSAQEPASQDASVERSDRAGARDETCRGGEVLSPTTLFDPPFLCLCPCASCVVCLSLDLFRLHGGLVPEPLAVLLELRQFCRSVERGERLRCCEWGCCFLFSPLVPKTPAKSGDWARILKLDPPDAFRCVSLWFLWWPPSFLPWMSKMGRPLGEPPEFPLFPSCSGLLQLPLP